MAQSASDEDFRGATRGWRVPSGRGAAEERPRSALTESPAVPQGESPAPNAPIPALTPEAVFLKYSGFVWRNLRRMGVPTASLDDAVQEVFIVVCRRLSRVYGEAQLRAWLYSVATHVAHKARRTERRRGADPLPEAVADTDGVSPQEAAARAEAVRTVYDLLEQLSEPYRTVFVLTELEQLTAPEIAATLEIPLNTVYSRLRAARAAFEAALARHRARNELVGATPMEAT